MLIALGFSRITITTLDYFCMGDCTSRTHIWNELGNIKA